MARASTITSIRNSTVNGREMKIFLSFSQSAVMVTATSTVSLDSSHDSKIIKNPKVTNYQW